ncbi:MAG: hypothetical protein U0599_02610 [Vicinamibacteria bacterium]
MNIDDVKETIRRLSDEELLSRSQSATGQYTEAAMDIVRHEIASRGGIEAMNERIATASAQLTTKARHPESSAQPPPGRMSWKAVLPTAAAGALLGWIFGDGQARSLARGGELQALFRVTGVVVGTTATAAFVAACWKLGLRRSDFARVGYWKIILLGMLCAAFGGQAGLAAGLAAKLGAAAVTWSMVGMFAGLFLPGLLWVRRRASR